MTTQTQARAATRRSPASLPGPIVAPNIPRRSMAGPQTVNLHPSKAVQAWLLLADAVIVRALAEDAHPGHLDIGRLVVNASQAVVDDFRGDGLDRRGVVIAAAAASHALRFHQPQRLRPTDPAWLRQAVHNAGAGQSLISRARVTWCSQAGPAGGLLIDRRHHTYHPGLLLDTWMSRKVALDFEAGRALAGDAFLGVRVLSHRTPLGNLHMTADGEHHVIGGCPTCTGREL